MNELAGERRVVAEHINKGNTEMGMMRVEQVIRIKNTLKAVEIIELYLEMIKTRLDYLSKQKEIPAEMRTPMLSIAFASTRLTDIPELAGIRKNFESRFGRDTFTEVTKGDPGPASGVQENLLFCLSVLPPSVPAKVDAALEIMNELGKLEKDSEDLRADLERACGMFAPRPGPGGLGGSGGSGIPDGGWLPATIPAPAPNIPVIEPTPVNDYGNPAPSYDAFAQDPSYVAAPSMQPPVGGSIPAQAPPAAAAAVARVPAVAPPAPSAAPAPTKQPAAPPPAFPAMPTATVPPPLPPADPSHAQPIDNESYTHAMKAAMSGATPSDSNAPVLDSTNAGQESYPGAFVLGSEGRAGSMPTPPPGAYDKPATATAADLMFPDAKWSDTPPNHSLENSLGALPAAPPPAPHDSFPTPPAPGSDLDLPAAPSHDPELPSAPKFSHTGVVYDETSVDEDKSDAVQDDLLERFKRLNR